MDEEPPDPAPLALQTGTLLQNGTAPVPGRPDGLSVLRGGAFLLSDYSDKDLKIYAPNGRRLRTIGRVGRGPGEFIALNAGQVYGDSIMAYDFDGSRVTIFDTAGKVARTMTVHGPAGQSVWSVRVVDDSLFLLVSTPIGAHDKDLLTLIRPDGSVVASFFNRSRFFRGDPRVIQSTAVEADGKDGWIFAGQIGGDSVFAFDYAGRLRASGPVDPVRPLTTARALLGSNGGNPRRPDGISVFHGNRNLIRVVALDRGRVAMHVARYDAKVGIDPLDGGTILLSSIRRKRVALQGRGELPAALLGRGRDGGALLVGYEQSNPDWHVVSRLATAPPSPAREPR
ncbi:MAG: 6-bladed beta-propeller [Gemmatimonadota bacterium]